MPSKKTSSSPISIGRTKPIATWQDVEANDYVIVRTCRKFFGSEYEDVAQDSRLKIWNKLDSFRGQSTLAAWMYRIAFNECLCQLRMAKSRKRPMSVSLDAIREDSHFDVQVPETTFRTIAANEAIDKLRADQRCGQMLGRLQLVSDGLSYQEYARAFGISVLAAKSRVHHARVVLRRALAAGVAG